MIIDREELEVWMIALLDREDVRPVRQQALDTWHEQGVEVKFFDAVTPKELPNLGQLNLTRKEKASWAGGPVEFSETEKAIWYSHFFMWEHCIKVDKPICIIEEDCMLIKPWPEFFMVYRAAAFCYDSKDLTPCAGYIITPKKAKYLYEYSLERELSYNIDHLLIKNVDEKKPLQLAVQVPRNWRTIEHW